MAAKKVDKPPQKLPQFAHLGCFDIFINYTDVALYGVFRYIMHHIKSKSEIAVV